MDIGIPAVTLMNDNLRIEEKNILSFLKKRKLFNGNGNKILQFKSRTRIDYKTI